MGPNTAQPSSPKAQMSDGIKLLVHCCLVDGCTKRYTDPSSLRKHLKTTHDFIEPGQYRKYLDAKKALGGEVGILEKELFKRDHALNLTASFRGNAKTTLNGADMETGDSNEQLPQISLNTAMTLYDLLQTPPPQLEKDKKISDQKILGSDLNFGMSNSGQQNSNNVLQNMLTSGMLQPNALTKTCMFGGDQQVNQHLNQQLSQQLNMNFANQTSLPISVENNFNQAQFLRSSPNNMINLNNFSQNLLSQNILSQSGVAQNISAPNSLSQISHDDVSQNNISQNNISQNNVSQNNNVQRGQNNLCLNSLTQNSSLLPQLSNANSSNLQNIAIALTLLLNQNQNK